MKKWRKKIEQAKNNKTSSFLAISRDQASFIKNPLTDGHSNLAKYNPKYENIERRAPDFKYHL